MPIPRRLAAGLIRGQLAWYLSAQAGYPIYDLISKLFLMSSQAA
jgi:hypothetical protein